MVAEFVSGKQIMKETKIGPLSQRTSHIDQCHPSAGTEKPEISGPRAGPAVTNPAQPVRRYGISSRLYISVIDALPVARAGEPKTPWKNRRTTNPGKLLISAKGIVIIRYK